MIRYIASSKYSKFISSVLAGIIFFNNVIFPTRAFALTGGPSQPEFSSFDPAGSSEMVNLFTGDFSYNIPLMDVDGYPVNIAYHASPSMDQEASWVGLGWNINAGAVNRSMRGLPDDFDGDPVHRDLNIKPYRSWGVSGGYFGELAGLKMPIKVSGQGGMGIFHSNYAGFGIELSNSNSIGVSAGKQTQGTLTAGLGVKLSSQDGTDIYPQLGLSAKMQRTNRTTSVGVNIGCAINSRDGLKSINGGISVSSQKTQGATGNESSSAVKNDKGSGIGLGISSSASIPASSQGYMPKAIANMSSQAYSLDFKLGTTACFYAQGGYISGYYAQNKIEDSQKDKDYPSYGYLFSQHASDADMLDFNREKDGMMYPEMPNMPIANYTFDLFSASAQGLNYAFRPHRNDVGILRDNSTSDNSFGLGIGGELMGSTDLDVGINVNVMFSNGKAGRWVDDNDFNIYSDFTSEAINTDYEAAYFKVAGEKNDDDVTFLNNFTNSNDDAYRVNISKKTNTTYNASNELLNKYNGSSTLTGASALQKTKRATRNQLVSYLNATEASRYGVNQKIQSYPLMTSSTFAPASFDDVILRTSTSGTEGYGEFLSPSISTIDRDGVFCGGRPHHISEMSVTQDNGSRYIYGIPLYNRKQISAMFNIGESETTNTAGGQGLVNYSANDASLSNDKGIDNFMEKQTMNDYSHGFLLTSILSSDYVDRSGNGPSIDDYGDYTKFNYSRIGGTGGNGAYKWRIPVEKDQAKFNQGLLGDRNDNKGVYLYGEKDVWYTQSIETKNYIAFFVLNDDTRQDAFPVVNEFGGRAASNPSRYLKEIRLYTKKDFSHGGIANAKPIKVVHFQYDYVLCPGTPNSIAADGGKLTLKKIWFTYGNSNKGKTSPYVFDYADIDHDGIQEDAANPSYNQAAIDRWGSYKPNTSGADNNLDFPYVKQNDPNLNTYAAAWSLTQIQTPAGSSIKVNYEMDDYADVQNVSAGQMFKIAGLNGTNTYAGSDNQLYDPSTSREFLIVDLESSKEGGVLTTSSSPDSEFASKYLRGLSKMYFRFKIHMDDKGNDEFVPGYADIDTWGICNTSGTYKVNGVGPDYYKYAYVKLKLLGINDNDQTTPLVSPVAKAGFQMGRLYLPQIVFPGSQPASGNGNAIKGMMTTLKDIKYIFKGINKALYKRNISRTCDLVSSVVRLYNPNGYKKGGGSRVSKITINDNWNRMSGEANAEYGQEYAYTTQAGGIIKSSGVASYEPLTGGDENSMRYPVDFAIKKTFSPNDEYFQEEPMGESFFPDPIVGYSKVTVKNISRDNVNSHATGRTEYEFFTAKDFPVVTDRTDLQKQRVKPKLIQSILKFGSKDKLYLSQGYVIKTNDMHGKVKSQKLFSEGATDAISGIIYHYKSKTGIKSQELDNTVDVIDKTNTIVSKTIGKTTDFYSDSRSAENNVYTAGISLNISSATCTFYVPLLFVWPSFGHEHREFKSMGTTKLIQQYGLIDYVQAFENSSTVKTKNLLYDDISGEVILTQTTNDFDDPVYNLKYPAYWVYGDMGAAFSNAGIKIKASSVDATTGKILTNTAFFRPGDEIGIFDPLDDTYTLKAWVVENLAGGSSGNGLFLVDQAGNLVQNIQNAVNSSTGSYMKILRSGRRNIQSAPMASLLSLANPVNTTTHKIEVITSTKVINSSAVEYSNEWHLLLGDKTGDNACNCTVTPDFLNLQSALTAIIANQWQNATSPTLVWSKTGAGAGVFTDPALSDLIQSFSWFSGCDNSTTGTKLINLTITKSVVPASGTNNHIITLVFSGSGPGGCNGSSCSIVLTIPNGNSSNIWNSITAISNFAVPDPGTSCVSSNAFTFDYSAGGAKAPGLLPPQGSGTSCYVINDCSTSLIQCGHVEGNIINPYVENIRGNWRVKKSYSYLEDRKQTNLSLPTMNGNIREDGIYNTFDPFWKYTTSNTWETIQAYSGSLGKWVKNNELDKVNEYGNVLQARDVLSRPSASLYGYNHTLPVAAANNTYYNQLAFDGFEDYNYMSNECSASFAGTTSSTNVSGYIEHFSFYNYKSRVNTNESHTGRYSIKVPSNGSLVVTRKLTNPSPGGAVDNVPYTIKQKDNYGLFGPFYNNSKPQHFVISVWAKENYTPHTLPTVAILDYPHVGLSVSVNGALVSSTLPKKTAIINGWQKLEYEFTVPAMTPNAYGSSTSGDISVSLNNTSTYNVYYDDIRIHPFNASMKSMVYDPYSLRLMAELDDRNFATFYEYDDEGTLVRIKKETEKGIYTIKESRSGLQK